VISRRVATSSVVLVVFLCAASFSVPARLNAQAPPGPIAPVQSPESQSRSSAPRPSQPAPRPKPPEVAPRTTLAGPWNLNRNESDDPQQIVRTAEGSSRNGNNNPTNNPGGGYPGGSYPGGGYPGGGYPGGGGGYPGGGGGPFPQQGGPPAADAGMAAMTLKIIPRCSPSSTLLSR
jgi:hypothetical protein